jgi:hypothetical protein
MVGPSVQAPEPPTTRLGRASRLLRCAYLPEHLQIRQPVGVKLHCAKEPNGRWYTPDSI